MVFDFSGRPHSSQSGAASPASTRPEARTWNPICGIYRLHYNCGRIHLTLGETRFGTLPHQLLTAAGFTHVEGVVHPQELPLANGDYVLGVNVLGRYAKGLAASSAARS